MRIKISSGALLIAAALCYFSGIRELLLLFGAITVHELGHAAAVILCGGRINRLCADLSGFRMETGGVLSGRGQLISDAAGPASGLMAAAVSVHYDLNFALVNVLLSAYNLLPALPLDGGRILYGILCSKTERKKADRILSVSGMVSGTAVILLGFYVLSRQLGTALILSGIWLLIAQTGIVKDGSVL